MIHTRLAPLYYTKAEGPFLFNLTPLEHQRETLVQIEKAMQEKSTVAIINASVTGSGKTLANYAYSLLNRATPTVGIYPTNELIKDQERALQKRGINDLIRIDSLELDRLQERMDVRAHVRVLHAITGNWLEECPIVLTNPDILYLLMYNVYGYHHAFQNYKDRVLFNIINNYPILVFDEFHSYNVKQEANAAFIAATIARLSPDKPHVFIFSSATPDLSRLEKYLLRTGIKLQPVHKPPSASGELVCEPVNIEILPADLAHWRGLEAIEENLDQKIFPFLSTYPGGRGVFILDSVYEAKLLAEKLTQHFDIEQVGELHGYLDVDARQYALERQFTIGTTTIDLGVDFTDKQAKDFIVFEARSAEQFLQRLGRIGRQRRSYQTIPNYALAFVPEYVYNTLLEKYASLFQSPECSREAFSNAIRSSYTAPNLFTGYVTKYAPLEATAAARRIMKLFHSDIEPEYSERLKHIVTNLFPFKDETPAHFDSLSRKQSYIWKSFGSLDTQSWNINGQEIIRKTTFFPELEQFRGGSDLTCAIYDLLDQKRGFFPFKLYHLPFVARRTQFREISKEKFFEYMEMYEANAADKVALMKKDLEKEQVLSYVIVSALVNGKSQKLGFKLDSSEATASQEQLARFQSLKMDLQAPLPCSVKQANENMKKMSSQKNGWLCWISPQDPFYLQSVLKLPPLFELFPLQIMSAGGGVIGGRENSWSIALGLSAIFMDSLPHRRYKKESALFA